MNKILEFIFDKKKVHQILFFLPLVTFYLTNQSRWLLFGNLILLAIMEVYKIDLENKVKIMISNRVKQVSKNKPLFRNWKDQIKDAGEEFNYIYAWWFFGLIGIIFIIIFIYSTYLSYLYSWILFGIHLFLIAYFLFLELILNYNFKLLAKNQKQQKELNNRKRIRK